MPLIKHMPPPARFTERRDSEINKMSTDSVRCIDIPVSLALGCKDALPLLEMHECRKHGRVTMTTYGSSSRFSIMNLLTYRLFSSRPPVHVNVSWHRGYAAFGMVCRSLQAGEEYTAQSINIAEGMN